MFNKKNSLSAVVLSVLAMFAGQASAVSCPSDTRPAEVRGEIKNNAISPGTTLGIAHVRIEDRKTLRCGVMGNGGMGTDHNTISFVHSLVCDDDVLVTDPQTGKTENIHSQLVMNTSGRSSFQFCVPDAPEKGVYGTFTEISVPVFGRGMFQGLTKGSVVIEGTINCQAAINMKLRGEICLRTREDRD
jgi:hypothetical protein